MILPDAARGPTIPAQDKRIGEPKGGSMARRRYQKGRLFLRGKKQVWVGRFREDVIGADERTARVERSVVLGTKAELPSRRLAERRLELLLGRINSPDYRPGRMATVLQFSEKWEDQVLKLYKPSTVRAAKAHLRCHILPTFGKMNLDEVGPQLQQSFVTHLSEKVSRKTTLNVLGTLSSMMSAARRWGYVCGRVQMRDLVLPEAEKPAPRFFSPDQARKIVEMASEPFRTMFAVAAMTGIRAGELLGLQIEDLDFSRRLIHIRRSAWRGKLQTPKSKASQNPIPMPDALASILQDHLKTWAPNSERLVFANRHGRPYKADKIVQKRLWPILDALGVPRCGLHAFRHMHSSLLLETGASPTVAQAQMRHSDPRITLGVYGHVIGDSQRRAVEKVAEILRPTAPNSEALGKWVH